MGTTGAYSLFLSLTFFSFFWRSLQLQLLPVLQKKHHSRDSTFSFFQFFSKQYHNGIYLAFFQKFVILWFQLWSKTRNCFFLLPFLSTFGFFFSAPFLLMFHGPLSTEQSHLLRIKNINFLCGRFFLRLGERLSPFFLCIFYSPKQIYNWLPLFLQDLSWEMRKWWVNAKSW